MWPVLLAAIFMVGALGVYLQPLDAWLKTAVESVLLLSAIVLFSVRIPNNK